MEFFPANGAYHYVSKIGFRTFIKINQKVYMNALMKKMMIKH